MTQKQLVFIDEAGDPGFKIGQGSSNYFVIALVIFNDNLDAEEVALKIKRYRQQLKYKEGYEFKFNKSSPQLRKEFLKEIKNYKFLIRAIVVNKKDIYSLHLRTNKGALYNYFLMQVLNKSNHIISDCLIRIDGRGERAFRQQLQTYLRQSLNIGQGHIISNLRFRDSKADVLIQLADMIAGTIRYKYERENNEYYKIIKDKINDIWEYK